MIINKISHKLIMYFTISLLCFSFIIGCVFTYLFKDNTVKLHEIELKERALKISETLSTFLSSYNENQKKGPNSGGGYGAYLKFIDDVAMSDVWIIDENFNLISSKHSTSKVTFKDLPENAENVVNNVFKGQTTVSKNFSDLLSSKSLTIGTPIYDENQQVIGAVLLHSPISGIDTSITTGIKLLLLSMLSALFISIPIAIYLSLTFTKPLKKMNQTALVLANGNYTARTNIKQQDEIGDLALSIDKLAKKLFIASKESEKLEKLRSDFISNISHELRTPVTVIRGSLEAICDSVITDPILIKDYNIQMLNETRFLQRLINDLLELSKLQNIDFKIDKEEFNLCDAISDVILSANRISREKNVSINYVSNNPLYIVNGDYGRLRQMIMTIVDNAIKFSPVNGSVEIIFNKNILSISDNGIGISSKELPFIFDKFHKIKTNENTNGTGLGLAIAKEIADRHSIKITVSSKINIGTTFNIIFKTT